MPGFLQKSVRVVTGDAVKGSAHLWNHNADAIDKLVEAVAQLQFRRGEDPTSSRRIFARISGNLPMSIVTVAFGGPNGVSAPAAIMWKYSATRVIPHVDTLVTAANASTVKDIEGGMTWSASGLVTATSPPLFNLAELKHTAQYCWGVDMTLADFPPPRRPMPAGGGGTDQTHKYDRPVEVFRVSGTAVGVSGAVNLWFMDEMGSFDGLCETV